MLGLNKLYFRLIMENSNNQQPNIDWGPLKSGGASFKTHRLVEISTLRIEYKASVGSIVFGSIFVMAGFGIFSINFFNEVNFWIALFGVVFASAGGYMLKTVFEPIVFDKSLGYFWKGKKSPRQATDISEIKTVAKLDDIYGIQVIKEHVKSSSKGKDTSYYSYEINLILNSGDRINVVDYGNADSILQDASKLSKFLSIKILTP